MISQFSVDLNRERFAIAQQRIRDRLEESVALLVIGALVFSSLFLHWFGAFDSRSTNPPFFEGNKNLARSIGTILFAAPKDSVVRHEFDIGTDWFAIKMPSSNHWYRIDSRDTIQVKLEKGQIYKGIENNWFLNNVPISRIPTVPNGSTIFLKSERNQKVIFSIRAKK